ncbi:MAG: DegT/DnrJ/EryC1/StrS family aminotransferase [Pseudohongiellaceae bacterium]
MERRLSGIDAPIPMVDLWRLNNSLQEPIDRAIGAVIRQGDFVQGRAVKRFEENAAVYLGVDHAIGVASGTDALLMALRAADIGPGDEVITTPFSFWSTSEAIHHAGATPIYVDIESESMNLDPAGIENAITPNTRAILPVHIFGQVASMEIIKSIADQYGLIVIEDAAQAFGAESEGHKAGTFGDFGCFSFYPTKPLGSFGDGGLVITDDSTLANKLRQLGNHGAAVLNCHREFGYNSRLDSIQAAVLDVKLKYLDSHLAERRRLANNYTVMLSGLPIRLPRAVADYSHIYGQYTLRCDQRDLLRQQLQQANIATAIYYATPLYDQRAYEGAFENLFLPITEITCRRCLSLPLYEGLSMEHQEAIGYAIRRFFGFFGV